MKLYQIESEWDIGEGHLIFQSKQGARDWLSANPVIQRIIEDDNEVEPTTLQTLFDNGLLSLYPLTLMP